MRRIREIAACGQASILIASNFEARPKARAKAGRDCALDKINRKWLENTLDKINRKWLENANVVVPQNSTPDSCGSLSVQTHLFLSV